jgi:hypothetical protein
MHYIKGSFLLMKYIPAAYHVNVTAGVNDLHSFPGSRIFGS